MVEKFRMVAEIRPTLEALADQDDAECRAFSRSTSAMPLRSP